MNILNENLSKVNKNGKSIDREDNFLIEVLVDLSSEKISRKKDKKRLVLCKEKRSRLIDSLDGNAPVINTKNQHSMMIRKNKNFKFEDKEMTSFSWENVKCKTWLND